MEERHKRLLIKQNPWWRDKKIEIPEFKRNLYKKLLKYAKYKQIIAICGLRRIGKTVLMKQIIHGLKTDKNNICYISFDDIDFQKYEIAEDLINYFLEFSNENKKRYLFLDEIQKLPNWVDLLKTIYDTEEKLKIFISGSASLELKKHKETLAGRILAFHLPVLSFNEFVRYFGMKDEISEKNLFREYEIEFITKKMKYEKLFRNYLINGAFPELLEINDKEFIKKYIEESVIEKTISDIAKITKENEKLIYELFRLLANSNAQLFEITNLANILNINRNLTSHYITLLEKSFLIKINYNYTPSVARQVRVNKKQYIAHSSIILALLDYPAEILNTKMAGCLVESTVVNKFEESFFWRTPQKEEVDLILKKQNKLIPIEIKYQSGINKNDLKSILKFCRKYKTKKAIIVTKDIIEKWKVDDKEILLIPAWLFLLTTSPN